MGWFGGKPKKAPTQAPTPVAYDNSGAMLATHWPIGVPARQPVRPFETMGEIEGNVPGTRSGGFASPSNGAPFPPFKNAEFERNVELQPYNMPGTVPADSKSVGTLPGGPGASPQLQPMDGNWPANYNYVYREMGTNREAWILPRLDGNRHVPNPVIVNPAMAGDIGLYSPDYTLNTFVGMYPSYNSNSYVTTSGQGTYQQAGQSGIPDNVVVAADPMPHFDPLQVFL